MITIPVKIKREDKVVMVKCLEAHICNIVLSVDDNISRIVFWETCVEILSKLYNSQYCDKPIRLNLVQAQGFMSFIREVYESIGEYEWANTLAIEWEINQAIKKKIKNLKR